MLDTQFVQMNRTRNVNTFAIKYIFFWINVMNKVFRYKSSVEFWKENVVENEVDSGEDFVIWNVNSLTDVYLDIIEN
jgi:hypothetical protein